MKAWWFVIAVLAFAACSSLATAGYPPPTFVRTNAEVRIPQVVTIQTSEPYTVTQGMLLYSENGISVIVIEDKTLANSEGIKTYYVDFIASQLPPSAYVILIYPPPIIDTYIPHGMAPPELRAILTVDVPELENHLLNENAASGIKSATAEDILRQFAIWAYMGVDLASMKGYWLSLGLSEGAWGEAENWLAGFAKASPAKDITELDPSISVSYEPQGYSAVVIGLTNNGTADAYVRAEVGTILNNKNKANQNITIGETGVVFVPAGASKRMRLESYCINLSKGVPAISDMLTPTKEKNEALSTLLGRAAGAGYDYQMYVIQEAVWYITDGRGASSVEAQRLLSDNTEVKTWQDLNAAPWNPAGSTDEVNFALPLAISFAILLVAIWFLLKGKTVVKTWAVAILLIAAIAVASSPFVPTIITEFTKGDHSSGGWQQTFGQNQVRKFSSYKELKHFIEMNLDAFTRHGYGYYPEFGGWGQVVLLRNPGALYDAYAPVPADFSTTNIQVLGVDEADIVKTDGKYIYVVSGNKVVIIDAYPAENARILSKIEVGENPVEIFINENKLVVFGTTFIKVFDVSDRENPVLKRDVSFDGSYFDSRMIGDYVYVIISSPIDYRGEEVNLPRISSSGWAKAIQAYEIYYFDVPDYSYMFTTIMSINTQNDDEKISSETFLMGATQNIFVSVNNIYITYTAYNDSKGLNWMEDWGAEKTIVHKISIADGRIEYEAKGEVPGHVLNQFSMDEHQGYFRIATTTGDVWDDGARNHVYVLDEDLDIVGRLEGLAPGERIYSARFIDNRAYLVTFKKVDPLFVIDLANPTDPKVLGELKIPGYSDYLHPYDETHIIGVGKDTYDMGSFAWYQGIKIALFDVSDPENPIEISKYMIGDRGTDSYALSDHKAFLFSRSKNLLVMPILLAEIDEGKYPGGVPPDAYGEYVWQGAYVFNVSLENGFVLKGRITHLENDAELMDYYWYSPYSVKRSLYVDDVLYTISDGLIKMNDLEDMSEINEIELPNVVNIGEVFLDGSGWVRVWPT